MKELNDLAEKILVDVFDDPAELKKHRERMRLFFSDVQSLGVRQAMRKHGLEGEEIEKIAENLLRSTKNKEQTMSEKIKSTTETDQLAAEKNRHFVALKKLMACWEDLDDAESYPDLQAAWDACESGDWLLWLVSKICGGEAESDEKRRLVFAACECARLALPQVPEGENRPLDAIETAERWARGKASIAKVKAAALAAYAATSFAAAAAYAAASFAFATEVADYAAFVIEKTTDAIAYADITIGYDKYATEKTHRTCAIIVRKYYPTAPRIFRRAL